MLTAEQIKTLTPDQEQALLDMGFEKFNIGNTGHYHHVKGYGEHGANGILYINDNKTFNIRCHSSVYDLILADLAKLREKGII